MRIILATLIFATGCMESIGRPRDIYACTAVLTCGNEDAPEAVLDGATCSVRDDVYDATQDQCNAFGATACARSRYFRCEVTCDAMPEREVAACE